MAKRPRHKKGSDPRCWDCHEKIGLRVGHRRLAPEMELPPGSGVVVCGPSCKKRPVDAVYYIHPDWKA